MVIISLLTVQQQQQQPLLYTITHHQSTANWLLLLPPPPHTQTGILVHAYRTHISVLLGRESTCGGGVGNNFVIPFFVIN